RIVPAWRIEATRLPEGEPVEAGITGAGHWTSQPPAGAERLPGRFVLPDLVACGRFLAPPGRYFPALHEPVPPENLVDAALAEVAAGARWVKLVADFPL